MAATQHRIDCPSCEEGKIFKSRYGGNDPDVWFSHWCEECDGKGNLVIEDQRGLVAGPIVTLRLHQNRTWFKEPDPVKRRELHDRQWSATADNLVGYGYTEEDAVRGLIAEAEEQREARENTRRERDAGRRDRLIRFVALWADARPQQYQPQVGAPGVGYKLSFGDLTEEALEHLAERIRRDFWFRRRLDRENRSIAARQSALAMGDA